MSNDFQWTKADRILYGVFVAGWILLAVAHFIGACRARPKSDTIVLDVKLGKAKGLKQPAKARPDESSSAAGNQ